MTNKFKVDTTGSQQATKDGGGSNFTKSTVDYAAMNADVIAVVGTDKKAKTVVGYPSGYIDLGLQPRPDFEQLRNEDDADQNKAIAEGKAHVRVGGFYDNGKMHRNVEIFCNPRTPAKAFTLSIDFPQYQLDKGKYFGDESGETKPYRMYMGGEWSVIDPEDGEKKMRIIQNHMYMTENTNNPQNQWALGTNTTVAKMCTAADLQDENGLVSKESITGVLGQPMMFNIRAWEKPAKTGDKKYFTENIKFVGEVPEGLPTPEFDEDLIYGVNFNQGNDPDMLNRVRITAKNTMKLAEDWDKSVIKKEIAKAKDDWKAKKQAEDSSQANTATQNTSTNTTAPNKPVVDNEPEVDFDTDIPFAPIGLMYNNSLIHVM